MSTPKKAPSPFLRQMACALTTVSPSPSGEAPPPARPDVPAVRGQVPPALCQRSVALGVGILLVALAAYAASLAAILTAPWWPLQLAGGILAGLLISTLFVVGHDACHGSLTPRGWLNRILGRVALAPSLTPFTSWEFAHNRVHHSYTNLRGKDYAWAPFSLEEYNALSPLRRFLERHYRSFGGLGTYYLVEYWWKHLLFPAKEERRAMKRQGAFAFDLLLVAGFTMGQVWGVFAWSRLLPPASGFWAAFTSPAGLLTCLVVLPFLLWNWIMGFAIFQHHNHPRLAWYGNRQEWDFFAAHVESTVHIRLPQPLEWLSANIMKHTAHHVNPKIPLYRLQASQQCLEKAYADQIIVECWSIRGLGKTLAICKLYDYENHRWLNFRGRPTSEPNPVLRALREAGALPRESPEAA